MVDLFLALGFLGAAWAGWRQGFIRQLLGFAVLAGAIAAAISLRGVAVPFVKPLVPRESAQVVDMLAAAAVFLVVLVAGNVVVSVVYSRVPFLASRHLFDEVLGAALSVALRVLELSVILIIVDAFYRRASTLPVAGVGIADAVAGLLKDSVIATFLRATSVPVLLHLLAPFVPEAYRSLLDLPAK
jgi:uncharacterized membrane protein required for colicin V production